MLKGRGFTRVEPEVSDVHEGLMKGGEAAFPRSMRQQRQTYLMRCALDLARDEDNGALCKDLWMIRQATM